MTPFSILFRCAALAMAVIAFRARDLDAVIIYCLIGGLFWEIADACRN